jgi:hypothetical protein
MDISIVDTYDLPTAQMYRIEHGGQYFKTIRDNTSNTKDDIVFTWRSNEHIEFKYYQIAHFRLLKDEIKMPYGTSILENVRRLWRNILLAEDAMLATQIIRGIDRLIYYLDVGAIDSDDVPAFIEQMKDVFKRRKHVDPSTGQIDLKKFIMDIDIDLILPKRGSNDGTKIDKIHGQTDMNTSVLDYLMNLLIAGLNIPKSFLSFDEAKGEGKGLALQDIRLARKVVRIQQSILTELNKIAITHLLVKGYDKHVNNFSLALNNPSIQSELLRTELLQSKINLFKEATDTAQGIAPMSFTKGMQEILGMTNDEIKLNLQQQYTERAAITELQNAPNNIKSGIFNNVEAIFSINKEIDDQNIEQEIGDMEGGGGSGGLGGVAGEFESMENLEGEESDTENEEETSEE